MRQCHRRQVDTLFEGTATEFRDSCEKPQLIERRDLGIPSEGVAKRPNGFRLIDGQLTVAVAVPSPDTDVVDHRVGKADMVGHQRKDGSPFQPKSINIAFVNGCPFYCFQVYPAFFYLLSPPQLVDAKIWYKNSGEPRAVDKRRALLGHVVLRQTRLEDDRLQSGACSPRSCCSEADATRR